VHLDEKKVDVEWDPQSVTRDDVVAAIREAGYEVAP
jgi:copper chaperone CopZ